MNPPNIKLRAPQPAPANFKPTKQWVDGPYLYKLDETAGVCKRLPLWPEGAHGSGYYTVITQEPPKSKPASKSRQQLKLAQRPRVGRWLQAGLLATTLAAAVLLIYPLYPEASYDLSQSRPRPASAKVASGPDIPVSTSNRLVIPKIGVTTAIVEGSSLDILNKQEGVWHETGNLNGGNLVLAGHRFKYLPPNTTTLYNLGKLAPGDSIIVDWLHQRYVYLVTEVKTVSAGETGILAPTTKPRLTIYTCSDLRQTERTVAIAEPVPD